MVPSKLLHVSRSFEVNHHAHVAPAMSAQDDGGRFMLIAQDRFFDRAQGVGKFRTLAGRQPAEKVSGLLVGADIQGADGRPAAGGEEKMGGALVVPGGFSVDQAGLFELAENAAEI